MRSQPRQRLIPPPQISKTNRQSQRDHNQNNFPHATFGLFIVLQEVVEVARARSRIRINAERSLTARGRSRLVQPEDRWTTDQRCGFRSSRCRARRSTCPALPDRSCCRSSCRRLCGRTRLRRRWRRQQRRSAHAAVAVSRLIFIAAASAAHAPSLHSS